MWGNDVNEIHLSGGMYSITLDTLSAGVSHALVYVGHQKLAEN